MVTFLRHLPIFPKSTSAISIAGSLTCQSLFLLTRNWILAPSLTSAKCHPLSPSRFVDPSAPKTWAVVANPWHSRAWALDHLPKAAASVQPNNTKAPHMHLVMAELTFDLAYIPFDDFTIPSLMASLIPALLVHSYKTQSFKLARTTYIITMQC